MGSPDCRRRFRVWLEDTRMSSNRRGMVQRRQSLQTRTRARLVEDVSGVPMFTSTASKGLYSDE